MPFLRSLRAFRSGSYYSRLLPFLKGFGSTDSAANANVDFFVFEAKHILLYKYYAELGMKFIRKNWMKSADERIYGAFSIMLIFAESFSITLINNRRLRGSPALFSVWSRRAELYCYLDIIINRLLTISCQKQS